MGSTRGEHWREICEKLVANDPKLTCIEIDEDVVYGAISDEGLRSMAEATKKNTTITEVHIQSFLDGVFSALSLAGAFLAHPKLRELYFFNIKFAEFGPIALAMCQNERLNRLEINHCSITSNTMEILRFLLKENALETLQICGRNDEESQLVDFAGSLANNKSLKRTFNPQRE